MKAHTHADFYENEIYHVYGRTNNGELLFRGPSDKIIFLKRLDRFIFPFMECFCWNMLPNHFHLAIRVQDTGAIKKHLSALPEAELTGKEKKYLADDLSCECLIESEWQRFFTSYAMCFNLKYARKGNLFYRPFKRTHVDSEEYLSTLIIYIHTNSVHHGIDKDFRDHKWSSWHELISTGPTRLLRQECLDWFGGMGSMKFAHSGFITETFHRGQIILDDF